MPDEGVPVAPQEAGDDAPRPFEVHLDVFSGPFDLLLSLITKHKLDITEVSLAQVTDEFISFISAFGDDDWDLGVASEFLVVAATLLDLKAARLLPSGVVDDEEDLALLEARDLLFIRLLQYRAFKQVSAVFAERLESEGRRFARIVPLEPHLAALLPELVWQMGAAEFAALAERVFAPKPPPPGVPLAHLHGAHVSVREQAEIIAERVRRDQVTTFRVLVADADETIVVVVRFLALLELYREGVIGFDQVTPLGDLTIRWAGGEEAVHAISSEFDDEPPGTVPDDDDAVDEAASLDDVVSADEPESREVASLNEAASAARPQGRSM